MYTSNAFHGFAHSDISVPLLLLVAASVKVTAQLAGIMQVIVGMVVAAVILLLAVANITISNISHIQK